MICPRCKENVMDGSSFCVKCGYNFNANNNQQMSNPMMNNGGMFVNNGNVSNNGMNNNVNNYSNNFNNNLNSNVSYGNNNSNNDTFKEKKNGNKVVIAVIVIILVGVVGFFGYKFFTGKIDGNSGLNNKDDYNDDYNDDSSIIASDLLTNIDSMYAVFNYKGKQISDFIYTTNEEGFKYGSAVVYNKDGAFLIDGRGKQLTKPGEYSKFSLINVLYDVKPGNSNDKTSGYYLSAKGKKLFSKDEYEIVKSGYFYAPFSIVKNIKTNEISYVGSTGEIIATISSNNISKTPEFLYEERTGYLSIYYGNKNYIIDVNNNKLLLSSFESENQYCTATYNDNTKLLIVSLCNTYEKTGKKFYYAFRDNKAINSDDFENKCYKSAINISPKGDHTVCSGYIFDKDLKNIGKVKDYNYIIDFNNYIKNGVVYKDGKEVKSLSCLRVISDDGFSVDGFYHLKSLNNSKCNGDGLISLYDSSGNKIENSSYYYLYDFDENGLAFAGDKDKNFFLINKKGEKISDNYSNLKLKGKYYVVTSNGKKGIVDTNGKLVVPCEYDEADVVYKFGIPIAELYNRKDGKFNYLIKKLDDNKEIYKGNASVKLGDIHMLVYDSDSGINSYYSYYTGKKFYEFCIYR